MTRSLNNELLKIWRCFISFATRLLNLFGLERRSSQLGESGYVPAAPVLSGTYVTPQTALSLTAVFSAINVIARDTATLPLHVYRRLPNGGLEIAKDYYLEEMLTVSMDDRVDAFRQRRDGMAHVLGWGNGYGQIARDSKGYVKSITMQHPSKTVPKVADSGRLYYSLDGDDEKRVDGHDMLHMAGLGFNGLVGWSPINMARQSIGLTMGAEQFGAAFYGNGAKPGGTLKIPEKLTPQARSNIRNSINQVHQGSQSAHQLMILEEGVEFTPTQIPQDDAQFIATRQFQVIEIARLFNIPPHKIGDYSESHLANVEEANLDYLTTTIAGWVRMLEAQYNWKLLSREERKQYVILHDFSALLRGNTAARSAYYQTMRNMGCFSADDILRAEGLNPIGPAKGGDKYLIQMQYQPLSQAGENPPPKESTPPPAPEPIPAPPNPPPKKKKRGTNSNGFAHANGDLNHD